MTISNHITTGGMANFIATVAPPNCKGIFVTQGNVTIQNLNFPRVAVADQNGAGIRGAGSYSIDLPNDGVGVIRDNLVQQGPNSDIPAIIHYGGESAAYAGSNLLIEDNVVVNDMSGSSARLLSNAATVTGMARDNDVYSLTRAR